MNGHEFEGEIMHDIECITVGIDVFPLVFGMKTKIMGENNENAEYILNETGNVITLRGKGSGFYDARGKKSVEEPLHVQIRYKNFDTRERTRELILNLIETVQQDFISGYGKFYSNPKKPEIIPGTLEKMRKTSSYNSLSSRSPVRIDRSIDRRSMEKQDFEDEFADDLRPYESRSIEPNPFQKRPSLEPRPYESRSVEPKQFEKRPSLEPRPYESRFMESKSFEKHSSLEPRPYGNRSIEPKPFDKRPPLEPRPYESRSIESKPFEKRPPFEPRPYENRLPESGPYDRRPSEPRAYENRSSETRAQETEPYGGRPEPRPIESRALESRTYEDRPSEPRSVNSGSSEPNLFENRSRPFEKRTRESRFEAISPESAPFQSRTDRRSVENSLPDSTKSSPDESAQSNIEKVTIGIESVPQAFNLKSKIYGPNLANVKHIEKVASALLLVEGKGCGANNSSEETQDPPYILVKYLKPELKEVARHLIFNLIDTIQQEYITLYGRYPGGPQKPQIVPIKKLVCDKPPTDLPKIKPNLDFTPVPPPPPVISKNLSPSDRFNTSVQPPASFGITISKSSSPKLFANAEPTPVPRPLQPVVPTTTNNSFNPLSFNKVPEPEPLPVSAPLSAISSQSSILNSVLNSQPRIIQPPSFATSETSSAQVQTIQFSEKRPNSPVESATTGSKRLCSTGVGTFTSTKPSPMPESSPSTTITTGLLGKKKKNRGNKKNSYQAMNPYQAANPSQAVNPYLAMNSSQAVNPYRAVNLSQTKNLYQGKHSYQGNLIPIPVDQQAIKPTADVGANSQKNVQLKPVPPPTPVPAPIISQNPAAKEKAPPRIVKKHRWDDAINSNNCDKSDSEEEGRDNPIILSDSEDEELKVLRNSVRISAPVSKQGARDISVQTDDKLYQTQFKNIKCACGRFMHVVTGVRSVETQTIGGDSYRRF